MKVHRDLLWNKETKRSRLKNSLSYFHWVPLFIHTFLLKHISHCIEKNISDIDVCLNRTCRDHKDSFIKSKKADLS